MQDLQSQQGGCTQRPYLEAVPGGRIWRPYLEAVPGGTLKSPSTQPGHYCSALAFSSCMCWGWRSARGQTWHSLRSFPRHRTLVCGFLRSSYMQVLFSVLVSQRNSLPSFSSHACLLFASSVIFWPCGGGSECPFALTCIPGMPSLKTLFCLENSECLMLARR